MARESRKDFGPIEKGRLTTREWFRVNRFLRRPPEIGCDTKFGHFDQDVLESLLAVEWRHELMKKGFTGEQAEGLIDLRRRIDAGDLQRSQFRI